MWPCDLEGRFYDGHDRKIGGSTLTQALLLRPSVLGYDASRQLSLLGGI